MARSFLIFLLLTGSIWAKEYQSQELEDFETLEVLGSTDLEIRFDSAQKAQITASTKFLSSAKIKIETNTLTVDTLLASSHGKDPELITSKLKSIVLAGSGDVTIHGFSGQELNISIMGSGDITVEGECGVIKIKIAGSGDVYAKKLQAKSSEIEIMGSGNARVHASEKLTVNIVGTGDVYYSGNPAEIKKSVLGRGKIVAD